MADGHRKNLMNNPLQHKPKNSRSKQDDKNIYQAMNLVSDYIKTRFDFAKNFPHYSIEFAHEISIQYIINFIRAKKVRSEFDTSYIDRKIIPDGGILFLVKHIDGVEVDRKPILIAEIKRQGTNDERVKEGKTKQATGNAIERLGKNLTGIKAMMMYEGITPFVCFGWGCDFAADSGTVLSKVSMLNEFYPLNRIFVHKRDGSADYNKFSPVSMFFREEEWQTDEMFEVMKEIAETSIRYYLY